MENNTKKKKNHSFILIIQLITIDVNLHIEKEYDDYHTVVDKSIPILFIFCSKIYTQHQNQNHYDND
jgi:hypothetical protein